MAQFLQWPEQLLKLQIIAVVEQRFKFYTFTQAGTAFKIANFRSGRSVF